MQHRIRNRLPHTLLIAIIVFVLVGVMYSGVSVITTWLQHRPLERSASAPLLPSELMQPPDVGLLVPGIDTLAHDVLNNIRQHGWNSAAKTKGKVTGGLYINWQMNDPRHTNALRQGRDEETDAEHDTQVDLYYLNALVQYHVLHPEDHTFNGELQKVLTLVKAEFSDYNVPKGWIYFFLLRDGLMLHDETLLNAARTAAEHYYSVWYDPAVGLIYNRKAQPGNANVEHTLNCGAALIDAGMRWNQPDWVQAGHTTIQNTIKFAYNPKYRLFYNNFIVQSDGQTAIHNAQAKPSTQGNGVMALVTAYNLTERQQYLDIAGRVLDSLFTGPLWDHQHEGLFFALDMGTGKLENNYKETRGQTLALIALSRYNAVMLAQGRLELLLDRQRTLIDLLCTRFYQATYHGFFYRVTPTYAVYVSQPGTGIGVENFFTTEAMGTALDALQQTEFKGMQI